MDTGCIIADGDDITVVKGCCGRFLANNQIFLDLQKQMDAYDADLKAWRAGYDKVLSKPADGGKWQDVTAWLAANPEPELSVPYGADAACWAWRNTVQNHGDIFEVADSLPNRMVPEFLQTLRKANVTTFVYTASSESALDNLCEFMACGCTITGSFKGKIVKPHAVKQKDCPNGVRGLLIRVN